jgi:periplasmic divalent cation tolerance protein
LIISLLGQPGFYYHGRRIYNIEINVNYAYLAINVDSKIDTLIVVYVTCGSSEEAMKLADLLVHEHIAACVNVADVHSVYEWQGKLERHDESLLIIKSIRSRFDDLKKLILSNHSYENPEIIALDISAAYEKYANWIMGICETPKPKNI